MLYRQERLRQARHGAQKLDSATSRGIWHAQWPGTRWFSTTDLQINIAFAYFKARRCFRKACSVSWRIVDVTLAVWNLCSLRAKFYSSGALWQGMCKRWHGKTDHASGINCLVRKFYCLVLKFVCSENAPGAFLRVLRGPSEEQAWVGIGCESRAKPERCLVSADDVRHPKWKQVFWCGGPGKQSSQLKCPFSHPHVRCTSTAIDQHEHSPW